MRYWEALGHRAIAFVPEHHLSYERVGRSNRAASLGLTDKKHNADDVPLLRKLEAEGSLVVTPPQDYDDSYCISYARNNGGCVVSNDLYRDYSEAEAKRGRSKAAADAWRRAHVISFTFFVDEFLPNPEFAFPQP